MLMAGDTLSWWELAAESGDVKAMHNLGALHRERKHLNDAEMWWERAADAGDAHAMFHLGLLLHERGDVRGAARRWAQAAATGHAEATSKLASLETQAQHDVASVRDEGTCQP